MRRLHVLDEEDSSSNSNPSDPRGSSSTSDPGGSFSPPNPRGSSSPSTPVVPKEERDIPNTPRIRRHVLNRDGRVCAGPGCGNRNNKDMGGNAVRPPCHLAHPWRRHRTGKRDKHVHKPAMDSFMRDCCRSRGYHRRGSSGSTEKESPLDERMSAPGEDKRRYSKEHKGSDPGWVVDEQGAEVQQEDTTLTSLDQIPDRIDSAWWRKHSHNLVCRGNRFFLKNAP